MATIIKIKASKEFIEKMRNAKAESKKRLIEKYKIDEDVEQFMKDKVKETYEINKGNLDKSSFRLGMVTMYHHLKNKDNG